MYFSLIIPVYNRPDEVDELLESLTQQDYSQPFEVVIIEDGSTLKSDTIIAKYPQLNILYHFKSNSGPGASRNVGMQMASGEYFLILDSDCILPSNYLSSVERNLQKNYADCFGGVDTDMEQFSDIQKAINFAMTSFLTTGGIRGGSEKLGKFQPRSFNMGISKQAFLASSGFGNLHPGEDPDLAMRLWKLGFTTQLYQEVKVFHKRRISWEKFQIQVYKFGKARVILNYLHPGSAKITYLFPSLFLIGLVMSVILFILDNQILLSLYGIYLMSCFFAAFLRYKNLKIAFYSLWAVLVQFYGYGRGFLEAYYSIFILKQHPNQAHPEMFFKK